MNPKRLISSLAAKPFVILTGNSGAGKTRIAEYFAHWLGGGMRHEVVPVGAGWTDNRNILGFVNFLRKSGEGDEALPLYHSTKALDLILKAHDDENKNPYFLILDEMNLSHVERYFSDVLSAMESKVGELPLHQEGDDQTDLPTAVGEPGRIPRTLKLPENLFIIGTVNVDETTYMFSPKVLDRANVLEFRIDDDAVNLYFKNRDSGAAPIGFAPKGFGKAFLELSKKVRSGETKDFGKLGDVDEVQNGIMDAFKIMAEDRMEFGFRTIKEILAYHAADYALTEDKSAWKWQKAFDQQLLQKIMPKLHGSKRKIESLLISLARFCETGEVPAAGSDIPENLKSNPVKPIGEPVYRMSYAKLVEMIDAVRRDQFVSYIH
jgi:5-methylcytosine-specific restriction protein B